MQQIDDAGLDFTLLRVFRMLLDTQHVTRAARRLGLSQSATSHALARLRTAFDDPLFVRGPRGVVPTDKALALAPRVHDVLARIEALAQDAVAFDPARLQRRFVIGGADFAEILVLPKLVPLLRKLAPAVDLTFRYAGGGTVDDDLARGALDMAIGRFLTSPALVQRKLFDEQFVTLLRTNHPALKQRLTLKRWAALDHVLISPGGGTADGIVDEALREHGLRRRIVVQTSTFLSAPLIVEATDCVTTMPARMASAMIAGRKLVALPTPVPVPGFAVMLAFHERSRSDPAHTWLREQIAAAAAEA